MAYSADKRNIVAGIATTLRNAIGCPVFEHFKYLDDINDFPTICLHIETDYKFHLEATPNVVGGDFNMIVRGYVHSENVVGAQDDLIQKIEEALNALTPATAIQIDDIHINSLEHDEGLFEPFGTVTVNVDIAYRHAEG
jgi:ribosome-associated translation inhibitor RaiA